MDVARGFCGVVAAVALSAAGVHAQQNESNGNAATVLQPALFADSLSRVRDTVVVRTMERSTPQLADKSPPEVHLRYALIEKRVFELTDDDDARKRAQHSFDKAKDQDKDNTWAHFGYGWALAHAPEFKARFISNLPTIATINTFGSLLGLDAAARAKRSLQRALEIDPAFEPAVVELSRLALITKLPKDVASAASASRKAIGAGRATPGIYTQLAELEMLAGNSKASAEAARAGMALQPDGAARRALGLALLSVPAEAEAGAASYMEGIATTAFADTALLSAYMTDVAPLLVDDDRIALRNLGPNEKAHWLTSFWERSAARAGRTMAQRLTEHFNRMQYALAHYQRSGKFGIRAGESFIVDGDNQKLPFDDRGLLYVRFGKPDVVITTPSGALIPPPNESWVYTRDNKTEMYHFHKFRSGADFTLSALEPCDPLYIRLGQSESDKGMDEKLMASAAGSIPNGDIGAGDRYLSYLEARARYDPRLATYLNRCTVALQDVNTVVAIVERPDKDAATNRLIGPMGSVSTLRTDSKVFAREDLNRARVALRTDEARPKYEMPLQAITQLYAFRGEKNSTAVTAAVLIPGQRFTPSPRDGVMVYPLSLSLIMLDSVSGRIERADTKPAFKASQSVQKGKWFRATLDMQATPAEKASYRIVVENTTQSSEGDIRSGTRDIPSFAGNDLMMSDLVVGESGDGRWKRGRTDINPIPSHQIEKGKQFKLFYEIYNLPNSSKYRTTISVTPKESGGITGAIKSLVGKKKGTELTFDDVAGGVNDVYGVQQIRSIGADLDAGEYELRVTIVNIDTQATTTGKTKLIVLGPKDLKAGE